MKTAKEIIVSTLKEEIPILTEAKYDIIAIRLVKELGLTDAKILSINEIKENGCGTFTLVRYNLELNIKDILLVEKYNGTVPALFFDPLYIHVLKAYFKLLGKDSANTFEITTEECVTNVLSSHGNTEDAKAITAVNNPVEFIRQAVNNVCDAVGLYRRYE